MLVLALAAIVSWALSVIIHEACHILTALLLGWRGRVSLSFNHGLDSPVAASCALPGLGSQPRTEILVRHAGWVGSTLVALGITFGLGWSAVVALPFWWTAAGAVASDALGIVVLPTSGSGFACGNFGVILLRATARTTVFATLRKMLRITMVRGAQSAGLVTYEPTGSRGKGRVGRRCRVVNGKRTDLSELLLSKVEREVRGGGVRGVYPQPGEAWRLFQGHTRFATSSICNLVGCHPHQWMPAQEQTAWRRAHGREATVNGHTMHWVSERANVEGYITHNGDLDFFAWHGTTYAVHANCNANCNRGANDRSAEDQCSRPSVGTLWVMCRRCSVGCSAGRCLLTSTRPRWRGSSISCVLR